jgi:hypothetical protein
MCFQVEGEGCDAEDVALIFATSSIVAKRRWANNHDWEGIAGISATRKPHWDKHAATGVPALERIEAGWYYECTGCGTRVSQDYIGTRERSHDEYEDGQLDREYGPDISRPEMVPVEPIIGRVWCHRSCYEADLKRSARLRRYEERVYAWMVRRLKRRLPEAEVLPLPPTDHDRYQWHAVWASRSETSYVYVSSQGRAYGKRDPQRPWASIPSRAVESPGVSEAIVSFRWPGAKYGNASFRICDERYMGKPRTAHVYVANGDKDAFEAWCEVQKVKEAA